MVHRQVVGRKRLAAVVAAAFLELLFPPGRSFEDSGLVPLFAKTCGCFRVQVDFEVRVRGHEGFSPPLAPPEKGGTRNFRVYNERSAVTG